MLAYSKSLTLVAIANMAARDMVGMPLGPDHQPLANTTTGRPMMATSGVAEGVTPAGGATEATEVSVGTGGATEGTRPPGEAHASPKESEIVSGYVFLD